MVSSSPTCLLVSCMYLLWTCAVSSTGWQWPLGGQPMGLILIRPSQCCTEKNMASPLEAVPPLNLGHYSDKSLHQGGRMTKFGQLNQIPVLGSTRSQGRGMVFLQEGNYPSPSVELKGTHMGLCQPPPNVTCLSTGSSLMTSCQVATLKYRDHFVKLG